MKDVKENQVKQEVEVATDTKKDVVETIKEEVKTEVEQTPVISEEKITSIIDTKLKEHIEDLKKYVDKSLKKIEPVKEVSKKEEIPEWAKNF